MPSEADITVLADPWEHGAPIALDGAAARWNPVGVVAIALVVGFVLYLLIGYLATLGLLMAGGVGLNSVLTDLAQVSEQHTGALLGGNAIGLLLGLGAFAVLLAGLHSSRRWAFLRLRKTSGRAMLWAILGLVTLMPAIMWAGKLNELLPMPDFMHAMEKEQMELLLFVLSGDGSVILNLVMVAVAPALCEEIFFRGLVQRNLERAFGAVGGLVVTGVVFGLFHLRLSQALPLIILGIYLAYLTWRTGSLWVPIVVHFVNNAVIVAAAEIGNEQMGRDIAALDATVIPWYVVPGGLLLFGLCIAALHNSARERIRT